MKVSVASYFREGNNFGGLGEKQAKNINDNLNFY